MKFTLVSTVYNEISRLENTISDLENQSLKPDEIVITDAGSSDGTCERLRQWADASLIRIILLIEKGCNVAEGRNLAIRMAKNEIIVSTDFGCRFHPQWLESLVQPFENPWVKIVGGAFSVDESSLVSIAAKANFILTNGYQVTLDENFIPSSRSIAYRKFVWEDVGGYCEWLTLAADDLVFGLMLQAKGYHIHLVPHQYVSWGRHVTMKAYERESYRYGLGDGEAGVNKKNTIIVSAEMFMRSLTFSSLIVFLIGQSFLSIHFWFFIIPAFGLPGFRSYWHTLRAWWRLKSPKYNLAVLLFCIPMLERTRWHYLKGYVKGYFFSSPAIKAEANKLQSILR
jgi:glycosyltransferase involved in cell wall biosynthesis